MSCVLAKTRAFAPVYQYPQHNCIGCMLSISHLPIHIADMRIASHRGDGDNSRSSKTNNNTRCEHISHEFILFGFQPLTFAAACEFMPILYSFLFCSCFSCVVVGAARSSKETTTPLCICGMIIKLLRQIY